jgi:tetratricopeptide (TPR) repeat protein
MKLRKPDLLLFLIYLAKVRQKGEFKYTREQISGSLIVKPSTINVYLSNLTSQDLINRKTRRYVEYPLDTIQITAKGKVLVEDTILEKIKKIHFTPERHFIDSCISFTDLSEMISNPLDKVFLLSLYNKMYNFDLFSYISNIQSLKDDSKLQKIISDRTNDYDNFLSALYNVSLYGKDVQTRLKNPEFLSDFNTEALIIQAESYLKKGDFKNSEKLYRSLLTIDRKLTQNQWFLINIGIVNILRKMENYNEVMEMLDHLEKETKDKRFHCYIKQIKAYEIGLRGDYDKSVSLFNNVINSSFKIGNPLLTDICYANRSVIHFIRTEYESAERDWITAIDYARKARSRYSEGKNLGNLADIEILKGNLETAWKYLDEAETIFFDLEDHEGISMIAFNKGFYYLAEKRLDMALKEFERFRTIAQPLPGPYMMGLLRGDFIKRAKENGFGDISMYL